MELQLLAKQKIEELELFSPREAQETHLSAIFNFHFSIINFLTIFDSSIKPSTPLIMTIKNYIENINRRYQQGNATEHTFRGDLQQLVIGNFEPSKIGKVKPAVLIQK